MGYLHRVQRPVVAYEKWSLFTGVEMLLAEAVWLGAQGGVCPGANLCPRLFFDLHQAVLRHENDRAVELQDRILDIRETIYTVAHHRAPMIGGIKAALACMQICEDAMAKPFSKLRDTEQRTIREHLGNLNLLVHASGQIRPKQ